jgi:hypothetical protein
MMNFFEKKSPQDFVARRRRSRDNFLWNENLIASLARNPARQFSLPNAAREERLQL